MKILLKRSLLSMLIMLSPEVLAQPQFEAQPKENMPLPPFPAGSMVGADKFVQMMKQSMGAKSPSGSDLLSCNSAVNSMFQFYGPDLNQRFWADPETAGKTLILQGELMSEMGKVLIRQGQSLLEKKMENSQDSSKR